MANSVQHRIMTTFTTINNWMDRELVLELLVDFFEGKRIHINNGWSCSRGHSSLLANREARRVLKILKAVDVSINFGNDAPRGGAVGAYFKCTRKNATASAFFRELLQNEVQTKGF